MNMQIYWVAMKACSGLAILVLLTSCLKIREVSIPTEGPPPVIGDTITKGSIYINEVNNRWSTDINLSNELSPALGRRFDAAIGSDWKDGKVKWFELYNNTNKAIELGNPNKGYWYLSDSRTNRTSTPIRAAVTIPAKGFAIVYGSDSAYSDGSQIHAAFNIGRNNSLPKDTLGIYFQRTLGSAILTVDSLTYDDNDKTKTWSRFPDGGSTLLKTSATPGLNNRR
jgi:hypothetical protein